MTCEPLYDDLTHCDACDFATYTIDGEAKAGDEHLCMVGSDAKRKCHGTIEVVAYGIPLDEGTAKHQYGGHDACEADAKLVEDDSSEEQEKEEHVEVAIGSREESVVIA